MNGLSVIIPSRNATNLVACVRAIREAGETCDICVVDDGLDCEEVKRSVLGELKARLTRPESGWNRADAWNEWVESQSDKGRIYMADGAKPFQFSRNVNIGIRAAGSDDVVICNDDALLQSPKGFSLLQSEHDRRKEFAIIGATTNVTGQPLQQRRTDRMRGLRLVPHIAFVCVFIPRSTLDREDIGYLDERYVCGFEDRDYCEAVNRAGLLVGVHDGCYVDHGSLVSTIRGPGGLGYDKRGAQTFADKWGYAAK